MSNCFLDISFYDRGHYIYMGAGKFTYDYRAGEFTCSIYFVNQKFLRPNFCDYLKIGKIDGVSKKTISTKYLAALEVGSIFNENGLLVGHTKDTIKNIGGKEMLGLPGITAHVATISSQNLLCKPTVLAEAFPKGYFDQFAFAFLPYTYCLVMRADINNKPVKLIVPCTEIARYFFFTGTNLSDAILGGTYNFKYEPYLESIKNEDGKKVANLKVLKSGLTDAELLTLAYILGCNVAKEAANLINSSLKSISGIKSEAYLQTIFPVELSTNVFRLEVSGFRLGTFDSSPFFVTQIHNTSDFFPFDIVEWNSEIDTRSIDDKVLRKSLPIVKRGKIFPARKIENTGDVVNVSGKEFVGTGSFFQELPLSSSALGLLEKTKKIDVIRSSKEKQKNQYHTKFEVRKEYGDKFSLSGRVASHSPYGKGCFVQSQKVKNEQEWKWSTYLIGALEILKNKHRFEVLFYDGSVRNFRVERNVLKMKAFSMYVAQICRNKCYFYFFEVVFVGKQNPKYLAMYYESNFCKFDYGFVENLIDICEKRNANWERTKNYFVNNNLNLRRFEHQFEKDSSIINFNRHEWPVEKSEKTANKILKEIDRLIKNLKM